MVPRICIEPQRHWVLVGMFGVAGILNASAIFLDLEDDWDHATSVISRFRFTLDKFPSFVVVICPFNKSSQVCTLLMGHLWSVSWQCDVHASRIVKYYMS